ncbi:hypothetical protein WR25_16539 [Diploscapter pachys]|uniref:Uncharacterized protein n=1 Tax=Diploscapter pachys TaxID=2018661 RepID=A0A2A2JTH1_9BILA|nr:hypothetical protein WR25_16539 [Diploscapter pachys]
MKEGEVRVRACGRVGQRHVKVVDEHRETARVCKKRRSAIFPSSLRSPCPFFHACSCFTLGQATGTERYDWASSKKHKAESRQKEAGKARDRRDGEAGK